MTDEPSLRGYWPSPWPGEDGGPHRRQVVHGGFGFGTRPWRATTRPVLGANMLVLREPGEVFLQGNTLGASDTTAFVERIDPESLEAVTRSPDLPGGPFWAGGIAAHRNGSLYVTYGRFCHRLDPATLGIAAVRELPRARPYNSLLILPDGHLAMKDFAGGTGVHQLPDGTRGSELVILEPDGLEIVARLELPEGSIARLSARALDDDTTEIVIVGDRHLHRVAWDHQTLALAGTAPPVAYIRFPGQTFGWDPVLAAGCAWFLDDGEGSAAFGPSFAGKGTATSPLHLIRVPLDGATATDARFTEICGRPGGIIANPPVIDTLRNIAVGYDSGNGVLAAFDFAALDEPLTPRWTRNQHHGGHMLLDEAAGWLLTYDYDHDRGVDQAVLVDLASGDDIRRIDTGSPVQTVLFPAPGWHDDFYVATFTTLTRISSDTTAD